MAEHRFDVKDLGDCDNDGLVINISTLEDVTLS